MTEEEKIFWMQEAIGEAAKAEAKLEVPIGALVIYQGQVIGRGHNDREETLDATRHAEIQAIQQACAYKKNWRLEDCQLFVTLEPCPMCSGAIVQARIPEVYFGAYDQKAGCCGTLMNLVQEERFNHRCMHLEGGVCEEACRAQLQTFFRQLRERKKAEKKARQAEKNLL